MLQFIQHKPSEGLIIIREGEVKIELGVEIFEVNLGLNQEGTVSQPL